jgi:DNA-binding transcriptional ArsR family regulator
MQTICYDPIGATMATPANANRDRSFITDLDKVIHEPARLMIVVLLCDLESADFTSLMRRTGLTGGNLSSHLTKLGEAGYVRIEKAFVQGRPRTMLRLTRAGRSALRGYRRRVKQLLDKLPV